MAEEVKLFRTWSSPFALRIVWALKLKGIEHETILEDITNKSPLLLQYNPVYAKVPVLLHNGKPICESLVILEYIDETWKQNPLFPQDPYQKAMSRFWANFGDDKLVKSVWSVFIAREEDRREARVAAMEDLKLIDELLDEKKFFNGDTIGYLDLALGLIADVISVLEEMAGLQLMDVEKLPRLTSWIQRFLDAPVIKESLPPRDRMITKFQIMREKHLAAVASSSPK